MDQSYSESDVSLSPSKIFERLQMLRQLQIMQRGKLQKHRVQYQDSPEISSNVTEIVSHFSNSTSYNTFRSLLQSSQEIVIENNSCLEVDVTPRKQIETDYIEGVSALNLSQESEFITNSPISTRSRVSKNSSNDPVIDKSDSSASNGKSNVQFITKNQISLDEMPILSPKKNFEELVIEKLKIENKSENNTKASSLNNTKKTKKTFLRRGEGMSRFGIRKTDLVIQNTKALPWRKKKTEKQNKSNSVPKKVAETINKGKRPVKVQIILGEPKDSFIGQIKETNQKLSQTVNELKEVKPNQLNEDKQTLPHQSVKSCNPNQPEVSNSKPSLSIPFFNKPAAKPHTLSIGAHPLKTSKGQTWASVLTKEQDNFLRQLKQSDYYKNFHSPAKSCFSESSCDTPGSDTLSKLRQEREVAEQNMFELLENKVTHDSFNMNNSFFDRFLRKNNLEVSGESTPVVLKRCLNDNPGLLHLHPEGGNKNRNNSCCEAETCSDYTECSETCSSVSTCCSCIQGDQSSVNLRVSKNNKKEENVADNRLQIIEEKKMKEKQESLDDTVKNNDGGHADMADMNAKLIATSELLKDRLRELEDEIETFRKENANLTKMREELDLDRQKFYEEKATFEQKYNEEKILSEYYLAEEKEKLNKQKQVYDRYVREIRGRLSKKEKDEVINLKKEISELKEEIRTKDAKSTSIIARLRNQIKITEKERKSLQDEIEKLKKENRRIQHSNEITRRLTNLKYLEQINKKLSSMTSKDVHSETDLDNNIKYKTFEIERQSRSKKIPSVSNTRRRAKSVPNLNVTSRYAKYFSQKDSISDKDVNRHNHDHVVTNFESDCEGANNENDNFNDSVSINENDSEDDNNLEKMYNERFQSTSPSSNISNQETVPRTSPRYAGKYNESDGFFIVNSNAAISSRSISKNSLSPYQTNSSESSRNTSKSPVSILSHKSHCSTKESINIVNNAEVYSRNNIKDKQFVDSRPKSPISILSNKTSASQRIVASINKDLYSDKRMIPSPEPSSSRTSLSKTNLNPTEIRKPDGSRELRFPNGNVKHISADGKYTKFIYYNGDVKENFYDEGRIKYFYAETKTYHTTHADGLEILEFSDGQVEKRYKDGSSEIRLPNGSVRYYDPKNTHVREEWRFPDGAALTVSATGEQRVVFSNGQVEVHAKDHKRREFPDGTVKLVYNDGTSETRYASGRVRIKDKHGNLVMDSAPG